MTRFLGGAGTLKIIKVIDMMRVNDKVIIF